MATFHPAGDHLVALVKGAPSNVVARCSSVLTARGVAPLDPEGRAELLEQNRVLAARGLRVIALADAEVGEAREDALTALTFLAFAGMLDPPAAGVKETIAAVREAGIRVVMLTGDQRLTGEAVARGLGLLDRDNQVLEGVELDRLSDEMLTERMAETAVVSRSTPEGKLRVIAALQRRGESVAMLGDGVNDAAALRQADIGVAMGRRGSDMAKEAADLVLADDRFPTTAAAIEEGRVIFDNIRKFVFYLFSCNLAEILVLLVAGIAGLPAPLLPLQILWLNLLTDTAPALALAVEPAEPGVMRRPPRARSESLLTAALARRRWAMPARSPR
ncbi:MAG: HAD-IC family P-type ATPase [Gemmatimonadota bacterium]